MSTIVVAPFSNSAIRDWPAAHFSKLIGLLLDQWPEPSGLIRVIGTSGQRSRADSIVRLYPADRVTNDSGRMAWPGVVDELRRAACVIGNNSGIAHLAASFNTPTVCIFGGSHQRLEWRPIGFDVTLLSRTIGCSPCHLDHGAKCPYGLACLSEIAPSEVAEAVIGAMRRGRTTKMAPLEAHEGAVA